MSEISKYLGSQHLRPDGSAVQIHTKWAHLGEDAPSLLAEAARSLNGSASRVKVVCDGWTRSISEDVERALVDVGFGVSVYELAPNSDGSPPSADDRRVADFERELNESTVDLAVAVGSGTINDITKKITERMNEQTDD